MSGGSKFKKVRERIIQARTKTKSASGANTAFSHANNVRLLRRPKISPHPNFRRICHANFSVRKRTHILQRGTRPLWTKNTGQSAFLFRNISSFAAHHATRASCRRVSRSTRAAASAR
jgi:hypothetical protein